MYGILLLVLMNAAVTAHSLCVVRDYSQTLILEILYLIENCCMLDLD